MGRPFSGRPLVVVAGLLAACSGEVRPAIRESGDIVLDDAGRAVAATPAPRRIVSLFPSGTEILVALGAAPLLVARTDYDTDPALAPLPSLGRTLEPARESIVALEPDLVVTASGAITNGLAGHLSSLGLRVYEGHDDRLANALTTIRRLAVLVGARERGDRLADSLAAELDAIRARSWASSATKGIHGNDEASDGLRGVHDSIAGRKPVRVLYLIWHSPPATAGAGTYVDDLIRVAGGENIFADVNGWADVSLETVLSRDPDVIVLPAGEGAMNPAWLRDGAGWKTLRAVREDRLIVVDPDLFNRPGPRVAEAARVLAEALRAASR